MPRSALSRRRIAFLVAALVIVVATVIGVVQSGDTTPDPDAGPSVAEARAAVRDAPPPLRALYDRGGGLIDVPAADLDRELRKLRGYPVVLNVWAEWCDPCRAEFPLLRTVAARYGTRVAFLGVNVDSAGDRGKAERFLREQPMVYPSLVDADGRISRRLEATGGRPQTVFLGPDGAIVTVRQGAYADLEQVERDLRLYAGVDGSAVSGTPGATTTDPAR